MSNAIQHPKYQTGAIVARHPASFASIKVAKHTPVRIALPVSEGVRFVRFEAISCCTAEGNYCNIKMVDGTSLIISKTLKWVADRLPRVQFVRAHASHLVNRDFVELYTPEYLKLEDGQQVPVSRSRRVAVKEALMH